MHQARHDRQLESPLVMQSEMGVGRNPPMVRSGLVKKNSLSVGVVRYPTMPKCSIYQWNGLNCFDGECEKVLHNYAMLTE